MKEHTKVPFIRSANVLDSVNSLRRSVGIETQDKLYKYTPGEIEDIRLAAEADFAEKYLGIKLNLGQNQDVFIPRTSSSAQQLLLNERKPYYGLTFRENTKFEQEISQINDEGNDLADQALSRLQQLQVSLQTQINKAIRGKTAEENFNLALKRAELTEAYKSAWKRSRNAAANIAVFHPQVAEYFRNESPTEKFVNKVKAQREASEAHMFRPLKDQLMGINPSQEEAPQQADLEQDRQVVSQVKKPASVKRGVSLVAEKLSSALSLGRVKKLKLRSSEEVEVLNIDEELTLPGYKAKAMHVVRRGHDEAGDLAFKVNGSAIALTDISVARNNMWMNQNNNLEVIPEKTFAQEVKKEVSSVLAENSDNLATPIRNGLDNLIKRFRSPSSKNNGIDFGLSMSMLNWENGRLRAYNLGSNAIAVETKPNSGKFKIIDYSKLFHSDQSKKGVYSPQHVRSFEIKPGKRIIISTDGSLAGKGVVDASEITQMLISQELNGKGPLRVGQREAFVILFTPIADQQVALAA